MIKALAFLLAWALLPGLAGAKPVESRDVFDSIARSGFSGNILVVKKGRIIAEKSFGTRGPKDPRPSDAASRFDIGSITKSFTGAALLRLHQQGRIGLDEVVGKYFSCAVCGKITIRQMAQHRSGLGYPPDEMFDRYDMIAVEKNPEPYFREMLEKAERLGAPGEKFSYNNGVYEFLAYLVQKVSGTTFENFVQAELIEKAGLVATGAFVDANSTTGKSKRGPGFVAGEGGYSWGFRGATGIATNPRELWRWSEALLRGTLFPPELTPELFRGAPGDDKPYGLGWFIESTANDIAINHGGATLGYLSIIYNFKNSGDALVVLSNSDKSSPQATIELLFNEFSLGQ